MRLYRSIAALDALVAAPGRALTIGAFDGLHIGHREILRRTIAAAKAASAPVMVLCFEPTPAEYFARGTPPARLTCFRERFELLDELGVDELLCPHFGRLNVMSDRDFVEQLLVERLRVGHVVVGHDFRYGARRLGTVESLRVAGAQHRFDVTVVDPVDDDGSRVSSTLIREALERGELDRAAQMLGRDYSMSGRVVYGQGLGKELGFPTANINLKRRRAPVDGIFAVEVDGAAKGPLAGVASVGSRPTVGGSETLLEVFIFDFDADLYGAYLTVRFKKRLRAEQHFGSLDEMKVQMHADVAAAKAALGHRIA